MACQLPPFYSKAHFVVLYQMLFLNQQSNIIVSLCVECDPIIHRRVFWSKICLPRCSFVLTFSPSTYLFFRGSAIQFSNSWAHNNCAINWFLILISYLKFWLNPSHEPIIQQTLFASLIYNSHDPILSIWHFPFHNPLPCFCSL